MGWPGSKVKAIVVESSRDNDHWNPAPQDCQDLRMHAFVELMRDHASRELQVEQKTLRDPQLELNIGRSRAVPPRSGQVKCCNISWELSRRP